jgi:hypothetical protein
VRKKLKIKTTSISVKFHWKAMPFNPKNKIEWAFIHLLISQTFKKSLLPALGMGDMQ